jgi:hypothetical protein
MKRYTLCAAKQVDDNSRTLLAPLCHDMNIDANWARGGGDQRAALLQEETRATLTDRNEELETSPIIWTYPTGLGYSYHYNDVLATVVAE